MVPMASRPIYPTRGHYAPPDTYRRPLPPHPAHILVMPLVDMADGRADAVYEATSVNADGVPEYTLIQVEEWCPPIPPQDRSKRFTDVYELPPLRNNGSVDWTAVAARRDQRWREYETAIEQEQ